MTYNWPDLHPRISMNDHSLVCWTRMQAEAGQQLEQIVRRKELERRSGAGLFFWGVGNAPSSAIPALARAKIPVPILFSVMKSRPKREDAEAEEVFAWLGYLDACGVERPIPPHAIVLSRARTPKGPKKSHYALICHSSAPLTVQDGEPFHLAHYRNAGGKEAPVGASQVTALLKPAASQDGGTPDPYRVAMRAELAESYWVKLTRPVLLPTTLAQEVAQGGNAQVKEWVELASRIHQLPPQMSNDSQLLL